MNINSFHPYIGLRKMHHHVNHSFCTQSVWNSKSFDSRNMIVIEQRLRDVHYDNLRENDTDWDSLIVTPKAHSDYEAEMSKHTIARMRESGDLPEDFDEESFIRKNSLRDCPTLKPEVIKWLHDNVQDSSYDKSGKGWCIGNETYRIKDPSNLTIWFVRRKDALNFVRTWSNYKKPTTYFNYFSRIKKRLNLTTNTLQPDET